MRDFRCSVLVGRRPKMNGNGCGVGYLCGRVDLVPARYCRVCPGASVWVAIDALKTTKLWRAFPPGMPIAAGTVGPRARFGVSRVSMCQLEPLARSWAYLLAPAGATDL